MKSIVINLRCFFYFQIAPSIAKFYYIQNIAKAKPIIFKIPPILFRIALLTKNLTIFSKFRDKKN
jgi:hypothetical protein